MATTTRRRSLIGALLGRPPEPTVPPRPRPVRFLDVSRQADDDEDRGWVTR